MALPLAVDGDLPGLVGCCVVVYGARLALDWSADMNRELEFLFDYGSPFSYLASLQLEGFAKRYRAEVVYSPILLGAVLKATGNASPMTIPAKARYMATELRRWSGVTVSPLDPIHTRFCRTRCG